MIPDRQPPRDWLLARHSLHRPQLERMRRATLDAELRDHAVMPGGGFLAALFRPQRYLWAGMAAVWIALIAFHVTRRAPPAIADTPPEATAQAVAQLLQQLKTYDRIAQIDPGS